MFNSVAEASAMTQEAFGKSFEETFQLTRSSNSNFNNEVANEMLNQLTNKLFRQVVIDTFNMDSPILTMFMVEGLNVSSGEEILENMLIEPEPYDPTLFVPTAVKTTNQLVMYIKTKEKIKWGIDITKDIISRAFTNLPAFNSFITNYLGQIKKSAELFIYTAIITDIVPNVKNTFAATTTDADSDPEGYTKLQQSIVQFLNRVEDSTDVPTNKYNLDGRERKIAYNKVGDFVLLANPTTMNNIKTKALPKLFHDNYLKIQKLDHVKIIGMGDNEIIFMDKQAYRFFKRIDEFGSQYFIENMKMRWVLHLWLTRGVVNWKTAFKFILDDGVNKFVKSTWAGGLKADGSGTTLTTAFTNNTDDITLGDSDWILIRAMDEDRAILKDVIIRKTGGTAGPDDLLPNAITHDLDSFDNGRDLMTGVSLGDYSVGKAIIAQAHGYIADVGFTSEEQLFRVAATSSPAPIPDKLPKTIKRRKARVRAKII